MHTYNAAEYSRLAPAILRRCRAKSLRSLKPQAPFCPEIGFKKTKNWRFSGMGCAQSRHCLEFRVLGFGVGLILVSE